MNNYGKEDFKNCLLNPYDLKPGVDIMAVYPGLKKLSGFEYTFPDYSVPAVVKNRTIRFINYFYSKGTPWIDQYPDYKQRKALCAVLAGFDYNQVTGKFPEETEKILFGHDFMVNRMTISFVAQYYSTRFSSLMALRDMYFRALESSDDPTKVDKVFSIHDKLVKLELELINSDLTPAISVALIQRMEEIKLDLKPEDVATRIREGKAPIDFEAY